MFYFKTIFHYQYYFNCKTFVKNKNFGNNKVDELLIELRLKVEIENELCVTNETDKVV